MQDISDICARIPHITDTGFQNTPNVSFGGNVFGIASCMYVTNCVCCRAITAPYQLMTLVKYFVTIIGNVIRKVEKLKEI